METSKVEQDQKFFESLQELKAFYTGFYQVLDEKFYSFSSKYQVVWRHGNTRLLRFLPLCPSQDLKSNPILFIPSLINHGYILDVMEGYSLVSRLLAAGFPCYLLDWGDPTLAEANYKLEDYYINKIAKALALVNERHAHPITLIGHCLGGVLSVLSSALSGGMIHKLVLLSCPWDFSYYRDKVSLLKDSIGSLLETQQLISSHFIRNFFLSFIPAEKFYKKFVEFSSLDLASSRRELFLRVEKWSLDNMCISRGILKEVMDDLASKNVLLNKACPLKKIKAKCFVVSGATDAVVPYRSTQPLINQLKNKHAILSPSGHIGILVGKSAKEWQRQLVMWLD